jgi:hypothetical protein
MRFLYAKSVSSHALVSTGPWLLDENQSYEIGLSTDGPESRALIDRWMTNCITNHEHCKRSEDSSFLPTRLLAINNEIKPASFRLFMASECPPRSPYMTLSHCWGSQPVAKKLRLLKTTFSHLREEQPLESLPKTFRDAMTVASRLVLRYVWIDRLCIYQDSVEDRRLKTSNMKNKFTRVNFLIFLRLEVTMTMLIC